MSLQAVHTGVGVGYTRPEQLLLQCRGHFASTTKLCLPIAMNTCGPSIRASRQSRGMTQEQLSQAVQDRGVRLDRSMFARIEGQGRKLKDFELLAIWDALGFKLEANSPKECQFNA